MDQKAYFVLLCALLASTCINGKPVHEEPEERSDADKDKQQIKANSKTQRYGIFNESCNAGLILDIKNDTATLVNGNEGTAVVIDLKTNKTTYISSGVSDPESLLDSSLDLGCDESEDSCDPSEEVLDLVKSIFGCLFKVDADKIDPKEGLDLITEISENVVELLKGDLKGVIELSEKKIIVNQDVAGTYNVLEGLATIFKNIPGGLEEVPIDLQELADTENGVDALALILSEIGCKVNVGETLGSILNDPESLLILLAQLSARESTGVNGLLRVLGIAVCYIRGEVKLEVAINVIIQVLAESSEGCNENVKDSLDESLKNLLSEVDGLKGSDCLSELKSTIQDLLDGNLELDGVNLSNIIDDLLEGISDNETSPLTALVKIVLELTKSCEDKEEEDEAILSILLVLIIDINDPLYVDLIKKLGIDIDPQECGPNNSSTECESNEDLYNILLSLPGVKEVTESLEEAVSKATCGEVDLKELVNNDDINESIKAVLQIEGYVNFDLCEDVLEKVRELITEIVSLRVYFGIDICPKECY